MRASGPLYIWNRINFLKTLKSIWKRSSLPNFPPHTRLNILQLSRYVNKVLIVNILVEIASEKDLVLGRTRWSVKISIKKMKINSKPAQLTWIVVNMLNVFHRQFSALCTTSQLPKFGIWSKCFPGRFLHFYEHSTILQLIWRNYVYLNERIFTKLLIIT